MKDDLCRMPAMLRKQGRQKNIILADSSRAPYITLDAETVGAPPIFMSAWVGRDYFAEDYNTGRLLTFEYKPKLDETYKIFRKMGEFEIKTAGKPFFWSAFTRSKYVAGYGARDFFTALKNFPDIYQFTIIAPRKSLIELEGRKRGDSLLVDKFTSYSKFTGRDDELLEVFPDENYEKQGKILNLGVHHDVIKDLKPVRIPVKFFGGGLIREYYRPFGRGDFTDIGVFLTDDDSLDHLPENFPRFYHDGKRAIFTTSYNVDSIRETGFLHINGMEQINDIHGVEVHALQADTPGYINTFYPTRLYKGLKVKMVESNRFEFRDNLNKRWWVDALKTENAIQLTLWNRKDLRFGVGMGNAFVHISESKPTFTGRIRGESIKRVAELYHLDVFYDIDENVRLKMYNVLEMLLYETGIENLVYFLSEEKANREGKMLKKAGFELTPRTDAKSGYKVIAEKSLSKKEFARSFKLDELPTLKGDLRAETINDIYKAAIGKELTVSTLKWREGTLEHQETIEKNGLILIFAYEIMTPEEIVEQETSIEKLLESFQEDSSFWNDSEVSLGVTLKENTKGHFYIGNRFMGVGMEGDADVALSALSRLEKKYPDATSWKNIRKELE